VACDGGDLRRGRARAIGVFNVVVADIVKLIAP